MNLSAPVEEIQGWIDKLVGWIAEYQGLDQALSQSLAPLFDQTMWTGNFASAFQDKVTGDILSPLQPVIDTLNTFLGAVRAVVNAIQSILQALTASISDLAGSIL
jgi:uncharacterized protein YukE